MNLENFPLSRRQFLVSTCLASTAALLAPHSLSAENESPVIVIRHAAATAKVSVQKLRDGVCVLTGSGGNIAVLTGPDGKLLIDAGITASRPRITEALTSIDTSPVKHLINTHWHFDHTDGNEWFHSEGARIIAQENTRKHLSTETRVEGWNFTFPPSPPGALPTEVFKQDLTLYINNAILALQHYGPAHTDSDISIEFTNSDILHVGDTWWNGYYPFIDYSTGGSIEGAIRAAEANVARVTDKTIIIPGHGPVGTKPQLIEFRNMLVTIRDRVSALKKQGKSLEDVVAASPTADFDSKWGGFVIDGKTITSLVYTGV